MKHIKPLPNYYFITSFVVLVLISTAILKILYPPVRDPFFYRSVGVVEGFLGIALFGSSKSWRIWVLLTLFLSILMGFSLYATLFGLPCSCMGSAVHLPRGVTLIINVLMLLGAGYVLRKHSSNQLKTKRLVGFSVIFTLLGFLAAIVYFNI